LYGERTWSIDGARDLAMAERPFGSTFSFCGECLDVRETGTHIGETSIFLTSLDDLAEDDGYGGLHFGSTGALMEEVEVVGAGRDSTYDPDTGATEPGDDPTVDYTEEDYEEYREELDAELADLLSGCCSTSNATFNTYCTYFACTSRSEDDYFSVDYTTFGTPNIVGAETYEEELLANAWGLLVYNLDICKFAMLMAGEYSTDKYFQVIEFLHGDNTIEVRLDWTFYEGFTIFTPSDGVIHIRRGNAPWRSVCGTWLYPCTPSDQICTAIEVAAWLFHELIHGACNLGRKAEPTVSTVERAFRWGMYNRYWCALQDSSCCDQFLESGGVTDKLIDHGKWSTWGTKDDYWVGCPPSSTTDVSAGGEKPGWPPEEMEYA